MLDEALDPRLQAILEVGESVQLRVAAREATIAVTDRRLALLAEHGVTLDIPFARLRRVQFDIERDRPATMGIVPDHPSDAPQVLAIPPEEYDAATQVLAVIGRRLARTERD